MSYQGNIYSETEQNTFFRKVLYTGAKSQLVAMDLKKDEDIGEEVHENVEQILFIFKGTGKSILDGVEKEFKEGDVVVVRPGVRHNFVNTGESSLKIFTVYTPANHIDGRMHIAKSDAEADVEDEEFGHKVA